MLKANKKDFVKLEKLVAEYESKKFTAVLSNPPYQIALGDGKDGKRLYSLDISTTFHEVGLLIACNTSFIYPASWRRSWAGPFARSLVQAGLKDVILLDGNKVWGKKDKRVWPISIVFCSEAYDGLINANGVPLERDSSFFFENKAVEILYSRTKDFKKLRGASNPTNENNIEESDLVFNRSPDSNSPSVKIYIKKEPGTVADAENFYVEKALLLEKYPNLPLDKWNVSVPYSAIGRENNFLTLISPSGTRKFLIHPPETFFGMTRCLVKNFDSKIEAEHFVSYMESSIPSLLLTLAFSLNNFGNFVPDLEDYTDSNPYIDWSRPLDPQLYTLFELTPEEIKIVEEG